ncbi:DUF5955 family protein [Nonomuraea ceibae]|uniref:DUF5955 family protein n=1 Tax=Nonomuraea ceibae TaxID=1935170 RepID=UPI001C5DA476|nr:DUF5955 family protein [Nonomuraea ceibae]
MSGETFRFGDVRGPVNAGSGNLNIHGHQQIAGRDLRTGPATDPATALRADLDTLRRALDDLRLTPAEHHTAETELTALEHEAAQPSPDPGRMGRHLQTFTTTLEHAGALAGAGLAVIQAITAIATWLGPAGHQALSLLGL